VTSSLREEFYTCALSFTAVIFCIFSLDCCAFVC